MRSVMRMRYYCDHCKKAGGSGGHMLRHEKSCTLNPGRVCRMCELLKQAQPAMADMLALLPDPSLFQKSVEHQGETVLDDEAIRPLIEAAMPKLRELTDVCPICVMAALRQKGIPVPLVDSFNFKNELSDVWDEIRNSERDYY